MYKNYFAIIFLFVFCLNAFSQELRTQLGDLYYDPILFKGSYDSAEGSPYLDKSFTACKINDIQETHFVRFNAVEGTVEVKVATNKVMILSEIEPYVIYLQDGSGKVFQTLNYRDDKGNFKNTFFELVHRSDEYSLYFKERKKFVKAVKAGAYKAAQPASFKNDRSSYFISDIWGRTPNLVEIPFKLSDFLELFSNQSRALRKFIKEEKLKPAKTQDLVRILDRALVKNQ